MNDLAWALGSAARRAILLAMLTTRQGGRCVYCEQVAVVAGGEDPAPLPPNAPHRLRTARQRQATIEHVQRRADGGSDHPRNLVMACSFCNSIRDKTEPFVHKARMMDLVARGLHPCAPDYVPKSRSALRAAIDHVDAEREAAETRVRLAGMLMPPLPAAIEVALGRMSDAVFEVGAHLGDDDEGFSAREAEDRAAERALRLAIAAAIIGDHRG